MRSVFFERINEFTPASPDMSQAGKWAYDLFQWLFCIDKECHKLGGFLAKEAELKNRLTLLSKQFKSNSLTPANVVSSLFLRLPVIYRQLMEDRKAMYQADPAAESEEEILLAYPGFFALSIYRIAHELWTYKLPVLPRVLSEYAHSKTGIDIHPGAGIGERFSIDHGTGVVIGETSLIGNDVRIYQGVTLGALSVNRDDFDKKRHPTIGNRVVIYANATILGGKTLIGDDSVIGGNVWITQSIPSHSLVYHRSEIVIKNKTSFPEPLNFII